MKYLKIEDNKGFYQMTENSWIELDKISKDDLLVLVTKAVEDDFEMDSFDASKLANKAHQIIYKHLHSKFSDLVENKSRFKDEGTQLFKNAIEKYSESLAKEE